MAFLKLENASVKFTIYNSYTRSFKNRLLRTATGGRLSKDPKGYVSVNALESINLSIHEGERLGVVGHNGAGKSTLLRLLCGVYEPVEGSRSSSGSVGSLIDLTLGTDAEATGRENIYLRGRLLGLKKDVVDHLMEEIIDFSELGDFIDMPLRTYSSGMHLRLCFSVSTILTHDILLMDEWLSVGDDSFKQKAEKRLQQLVQKAKILVIASHSRDTILQTCNRVVWLENGKVRLDSDPDHVLKSYFN